MLELPKDRAANGSELTPLGRGRRGFKGVVAAVGAFGADPKGAHRGGVDQGELERRLLEIGFVEGASVEILHEGAIGGDPIAVRLGDTRVALRRREADAVLVEVEAIGVAKGGRRGFSRAA